MIGSLNEFISEYEKVSSVFPKYVNDTENIIYGESIEKLTNLTQYFLANHSDAKILIDRLADSKDEGVLSMISQLALMINYRNEDMISILNKLIDNNKDNFFGTYLQIKLNDLRK